MLFSVDASGRLCIGQICQSTPMVGNFSKALPICSERHFGSQLKATTCFPTVHFGPLSCGSHLGLDSPDGLPADMYAANGEMDHCGFKKGPSPRKGDWYPNG